jgi:FkbM family methyltransferase
MKYYAEFATDQYIIENFFPNKKNGIMAEIGAALPEHISTSKAFRDLGWRCICVEPNPYYADLHRKAGNEIYEFALSNESGDNIEFEIWKTPGGTENDAMSYSCVKGKYGHIPPEAWTPWKKDILVKVITFNELLESLNLNHIDFVSIDVEGSEIDVMKGFDVKKYQPQIVLLENLDHSDVYHLLSLKRLLI